MCCVCYVLAGAGVVLCIEKALAQAGVSRQDVNYVNAHATSTQAGDLQEYKALIRSFGKNAEVGIIFIMKIWVARTFCRILSVVLNVSTLWGGTLAWTLSVCTWGCCCVKLLWCVGVQMSTEIHSCVRDQDLPILLCS